MALASCCQMLWKLRLRPPVAAACSAAPAAASPGQRITITPEPRACLTVQHQAASAHMLPVFPPFPAECRLTRVRLACCFPCRQRGRWAAPPAAAAAAVGMPARRPVLASPCQCLPVPAAKPARRGSPSPPSRTGRPSSGRARGRARRLLPARRTPRQAVQATQPPWPGNVLRLRAPGAVRAGARGAREGVPNQVAAEGGHCRIGTADGRSRPFAEMCFNGRCVCGARVCGGACVYGLLLPVG
jgi:hypothetical protein